MIHLCQMWRKEQDKINKVLCISRVMVSLEDEMTKTHANAKQGAHPKGLCPANPWREKQDNCPQSPSLSRLCFGMGRPDDFFVVVCEWFILPLTWHLSRSFFLESMSIFFVFLFSNINKQRKKNNNNRKMNQQQKTRQWRRVKSENRPKAARLGCSQ